MHVITLPFDDVIRTQIQLTGHQATELKRLAAEKGVSMASLIREAVDELLRNRNRPSWDEIVERAIAAIGACSSGVGDLSDRHDDYFADSVLHPDDK